jgi:hypothetical protein|nr:hypothetical protein [Mycobacterium rhizamassiliense]
MERREIRLELVAIGPVRRRPVVGVDVGGEDPVEQLPALGIDRQAVEVHQLSDGHNVAVGHGSG